MEAIIGEVVTDSKRVLVTTYGHIILDKDYELEKVGLKSDVLYIDSIPYINNLERIDNVITNNDGKFTSKFYGYTVDEDMKVEYIGKTVNVLSVNPFKYKLGDEVIEHDVRSMTNYPNYTVLSLHNGEEVKIYNHHIKIGETIYRKS